MIDPNDPNYRPRDYRMIGIVLSIAAVVLFAYAAFSHRWLENTGFGSSRVGFSLIAFEVCVDLENSCETMSTFALIKEVAKTTRRNEEKPSSVFAPAGVATMALILLSVLALGATAFFAWKKRRLATPWPSIIALLAIIGALLLGCLFIGKKPGGYGAVGVGPSFWAFAIASVVGIAGAQMLNKFLKPVDPFSTMDA